MEEKIDFKEFIGKKVLIRSAEAGVYFGTLVAFGDTTETVIMKDVRNIWSWSEAASTLQIDNDGIGGGKVTVSVPRPTIINGVCFVSLLSDKAIDNLYNQPVWKM